MINSFSNWVLKNCKFAQIDKFAYSQNGWSILAYPNKSSQKLISDFASTLDLEGTEKMPDSELHITLRYWKDEKTKKEEIIQWLKENVKPIEIKCKANGMEMLGKDKDALTINWISPKMVAFQKKIDNALQNLDVPPSDFPTFIAHTTLANNASEKELGNPDFEAFFDIIQFKHGNEVILEIS